MAHLTDNGLPKTRMQLLTRIRIHPLPVEQAQMKGNTLDRQANLEGYVQHG